jgi:hypothetical protein
MVKDRRVNVWVARSGLAHMLFGWLVCGKGGVWKVEGDLGWT